MKGIVITMTRLKKTYLNALVNVYAEHPEVFPEDIDFSEFFEHELEALTKRRAKTDAAHAEFDAKLLEVLRGATKALSAMDVIRTGVFAEDISTQKIASGMARLVDSGEVEKIKGEKGILYQLATAEEVGAE